jgi:hypothetical protein
MNSHKVNSKEPEVGRPEEWGEYFIGKITALGHGGVLPQMV